MSHRSYRPVLPTGNKLLQKKWDQTYYDEHRRLVRNCQPNHVTAYSWPYIALFPDPSPSHLIVSSSTKWNIPPPYTISITNPPPYLTVWPTVSMFSCTTILIMSMYDTVTVLDCLLNLMTSKRERGKKKIHMEALKQFLSNVFAYTSPPKLWSWSTSD